MSMLHRIRRRLARTPLRAPLVRYRHRQLRDGDVLVAAYPRSGSTWLRFLLYELAAGRPATFEAVNAGIPDIGQAMPDELLPGGGRLIKTHEPYYPVYRRAVYLVRDVRDVTVSEYHYQRKVGAFVGSLDDFIEPFLDGRVNAYGSWQDHVRSWLDSPIAPDDLCVVRYEHLKAGTAESLARIGAFLGTEWTEDRLRAAVENNSVRRMRQKEEAAGAGEIRGRGDVPFVRRGAAGGWSETLRDDQARAIQEACADLLARLDYEPRTGANTDGGDPAPVAERQP